MTRRGSRTARSTGAARPTRKGAAGPPRRGGARSGGRRRAGRGELPAIELPRGGAKPSSVGGGQGGTSTPPSPTPSRAAAPRRWAPGNSLEAVEQEYRDLLAGVAAETG